MASTAASVCSRLSAQRTVATPALSLISLSARCGVLFLKSCKASLHFPCSARKRLRFAVASGSTAGAFAGTCAMTGLLAVSTRIISEIRCWTRFIKIKWGRRGWPPAPLYVLCLGLIVELQRKLDVSRRLRIVNHSGSRSSHCCIGYGKVDAVKRIQEVRAELQLESFCELEVLLQAEIPVVISRSAQSTELRCTSTEARRIGVVIGVKPSNTTTLTYCSVTPAKYCVGSVAIRAQTARVGTRLVRTVIIKSQGEARVQSDDWANRPTAYHRVHALVHVAAELFALAKRQIIDSVGGEVMSFVVVAWRPFCLRIVDILPIRRGSRGCPGA